MATIPDRLDRFLRTLLRVPGIVVDAVDGQVVVPQTEDVRALAPVVRATAEHPEAYLALEPDVHVLRHDDLVLGWQHRGRTAFAVGGLNAPPARRVELLGAYRLATSTRGLVRQLAFPLRADELDDAAAAGFSAVQVGVEAWLDLEDFHTRGKRFEHVRQMRNRARRRGVEVTEVDPAEHREALADVHARWLRAKRPSWRMKLLVGSPNLDQPLDRRYLVATRDGVVEGFITLLPGPDGVWGLDVMCRAPDATPGTVERLLLHAAETLRDEGAIALSLGACPMAGVPWSWRRPILSVAFRVLYDSWLGNRIFGFRNLWRFKEKFRPRWEPVFIGAAPRMGVMALYRGCRMWGLY